MSEDLLHFIWEFQLYAESNRNLTTTQGESIQVLQIGQHNTDAGPDFINALVKINKTLWAGNIEIHVKSSDWTKHKHGEDKAYNSVVLHVVYEEDIPIVRYENKRIPCVELGACLPENLLKRYYQLKNNNDFIPCTNLISKVPMLDKLLWLERMRIERIEEKVNPLDVRLDSLHGDWQQVFFETLVASLGRPINTEPFLRLAQILPIKLLMKHRNSLLQLEALLFGQAGLLEASFSDEYPRHLFKEYQFLKQKYNLQAIPSTMWKFSRLRPSHFPTIRIAQLAVFLHKHIQSLNELSSIINLKDLKKYFDVDVSEYWTTHYIFDKLSRKASKKIGVLLQKNILINTVVPFLFLYGIKHGEEMYKTRAIQLLEDLSPENNNITRIWSKLGIKSKNAGDSQALIQLYNNYCQKKRCLKCSIGTCIVKSSEHL